MNLTRFTSGFMAPPYCQKTLHCSGGLFYEAARYRACASRTAATMRKLLQLVLHFGDSRLGAGFLHGLATWRPAQADRADCLFTDHDRNAAAERNDVRKTALAGDIAFGGAFRPVGGGPPERQRGVGLAAGEFEIVRRRSVALEKYAQPAGAIENRDRYAGRALVQSGFRNDQGHLDRNVFLRKHLCFCRRRCRNQSRQNSHEAQSNRHRILPFHCPVSVHGQLRPRRMADYVTPDPIAESTAATFDQSIHFRPARRTSFKGRERDPGRFRASQRSKDLRLSPLRWPARRLATPMCSSRSGHSIA